MEKHNPLPGVLKRHNPDGIQAYFFVPIPDPIHGFEMRIENGALKVIGDLQLFFDWMKKVMPY